MFTGLITHTGHVVSIDPEHLVIETLQPMKLVKGQSVAVCGCCLTVVDFNNKTISFDLNPETWNITRFSTLQKGDVVNIENSISVGQYLDGHYVSGHVDTTGTIENIEKEDNAYHFTISFDPVFKNWVVTKGSIAIDGISLTINRVDDASITVCIIPHTLEVTNLSQKKTGETVNIEFDMMAKFFEKQIIPYVESLREVRS